MICVLLKVSGMNICEYICYMLFYYLKHYTFRVKSCSGFINGLLMSVKVSFFFSLHTRQSICHFCLFFQICSNTSNHNFSSIHCLPRHCGPLWPFCSSLSPREFVAECPDCVRAPGAAMLRTDGGAVVEPGG